MSFQIIKIALEKYTTEQLIQKPTLLDTSTKYHMSQINNKYYSITLHLYAIDGITQIQSNNIYSNAKSFEIRAKSWEWDDNDTKWKEYNNGWGDFETTGFGAFVWTQDKNASETTGNNGRGFSVPVSTSTTISIKVRECTASITLYIIPPPSPNNRILNTPTVSTQLPTLLYTSINYYMFPDNNKYYSITLYLNRITIDGITWIPSNNIYSNAKSFEIRAKSWEWDDNDTKWKEYHHGWGKPNYHGNFGYEWTQDNNATVGSLQTGRGFSLPVGKSTTTISFKAGECIASIKLNIIPPPNNRILNTPIVSTQSPNNRILNTPTSIEVIKQQVTNQLNNLPTTATKKEILDAFQAITEKQPVSTTIECPDQYISTFNNNPGTYPELVGNTLPIAIATTTTNSSTGNQVVDISQVQTGILLVVPALIEGTTIEIGGIKVLRGTDERRKQLSTNNGTNWFSIGTPIIVGNKLLVLSGLGSPVVLTVENYNPNTFNNPSTVLDYLFYFCYPVSFIGATFYGIVSIMNVDPATIIANKNVSIAINIYIGLCAFISVFIWFNYKNPILGRNVYNQNSSKKIL